MSYVLYRFGCAKGSVQLKCQALLLSSFRQPGNLKSPTFKIVSKFVPIKMLQMANKDRIEQI